jgi:hypothetical protein
LTHTLRALFAALAAALAIACAGAGAGTAAREAGVPSLRRVQSVEKAQAAAPAPARLLVRAASRLLDGPPRRTGTPPRMASPADPPDDAWFSARSVLQRAAGARTRRMLTLALARRLAAARDGTLSARSTGVPPPPSA